MGFDWTTVLNDQDKSIEGLLARRDMTKQMNAQMQIAQAQEQRRHTGVQEAHAAKQLEQQAAQIQESQLYRQQEAEARHANTATDNRRARYATGIAGRQPGFRAGPEHMALEGEFGNPDQYEQDPNDPNMHIYLRAKAAQLQHQADTLEQTRQAAEQRAKEDQARQDRDEQRRDREEAARNKRDDADRKRDEAADKERNKKANELTGLEKIRLDAETAKILAQTATPAKTVMGVQIAPATDTMTEDEAREKALEQILKNREAILGPSESRRVTVPTQGGQPTETPEARRKRLLGG